MVMNAWKRSMILYACDGKDVASVKVRTQKKKSSKTRRPVSVGGEISSCRHARDAFELSTRMWWVLKQASFSVFSGMMSGWNDWMTGVEVKINFTCEAEGSAAHRVLEWLAGWRG